MKQESRIGQKPIEVPAGTPVEWVHFFSRDPYEVLGLSPTASDRQIRKAKHDLLRAFHPDLPGHNELTNQIASKISSASQAIKDERDRLGTPLAPPAEPPPDPVPANPTEPVDAAAAEAAEFNQRVLNALKLGATHFKQFVIDQKRSGVPVKQIRRAVETQAAQHALLEKLTENLQRHGCNAGPGLTYLAAWQEAGVNHRPFLKRPAIQQLFADVLLKKIRATNSVNSDIPANYILPWKTVGMDFSAQLAQPDVRQVVQNAAIEKIQVYGSNGPQRFVTFVESWKTVQVDLTDVINSMEARQLLEEQALLKHKISGQEIFQAFVVSWMTQAHWQPTPAVLALLQE